MAENKREKELFKKLKNNPEMFDRIEAIFNLANESPECPIRTADEVEELLIEEVRKLGNETLHSWAVSAEEKASDSVKKTFKKVQQREKNVKMVKHLW